MFLQGRLSSPGDAAAALIGRKYGKHKTVNGKSWEGFFAFIIVGYAALAIVLFIPGLLREFYLWGLAGVVLAAAAELFQKQLKVDDNFSIPLCVGACLYIGFRFF